MARAKRDRRPARADSKAAGPVRVIPAGWQKCGQCGKTLPAEVMQPDLPPEWTACKPCWAKSRDMTNKRKNPGDAVELKEVAR